MSEMQRAQRQPSGHKQPSPTSVPSSTSITTAGPTQWPHGHAEFCNYMRPITPLGREFQSDSLSFRFHKPRPVLATTPAKPPLPNGLASWHKVAARKELSAAYASPTTMMYKMAHDQQLRDKLALNAAVRTEHSDSASPTEQVMTPRRGTRCQGSGHPTSPTPEPCRQHRPPSPQNLERLASPRPASRPISPGPGSYSPNLNHKQNAAVWTMGKVEARVGGFANGACKPSSPGPIYLPLHSFTSKTKQGWR